MTLSWQLPELCWELKVIKKSDQLSRKIAFFSLATGNESSAIKLWDPRSGMLKQTLKGHAGNLRAVAFSPDGRTLASGGEDRSVRLWNCSTWEELMAFPTDDAINGLAFDRDSKTLAAALHNGTVVVWTASANSLR